MRGTCIEELKGREKREELCLGSRMVKHKRLCLGKQEEMCIGSRMEEELWIGKKEEKQRQLLNDRA